MCGRYAASANPDGLVEVFEIDEDHTGEPTRSVLVNPQDPPAGTPDYNMAPSKQAPVVLERVPRGAAAGGEDSAQEPPPDVARQLRLLTWGLVPSWAKDVKIGMRMINARAETLLEKNAFATAAESRRCLVPAAGWYEWQASPTVKDAKGKPRKQPFYFHREDGAPIAFAGLYEFWRDRSVADNDDPMAWLTTFTIITQQAEPGLDRVHERQPVVLDPQHHERWLAPTVPAAGVMELLEPGEPGRFVAHPVGRGVGSSRAKGPGLIEPAPASELQGVVDPMTGEVIG